MATMADIEDARNPLSVFSPEARTGGKEMFPPDEPKSCGQEGPEKKAGGCAGCGEKKKAYREKAAPDPRPITTSVFELLKIGIGPSSSHTVGPLVACRTFCRDLVAEGLLEKVARVRVELCGSLALTGIGHGTNKAVILGLTGVAPAEIDTTTIESFLKKVAASGKLTIGFPGDKACEKSGYKEIDFDEHEDVTLHAEEMPLHPNGMTCQALGAEGGELKNAIYYSVGGGFILTEQEMMSEAEGAVAAEEQRKMPLPFTSASDLVRACRREGLSIAELMRKNEEAQRTPEEVEAGLADIWRAMEACVNRGLEKDKAGVLLPGPLGIVRRAPDLYMHVNEEDEDGSVLPGLMDDLRWLDCYALAVMEENACMGQVVTAPTNGAAGVVPGMLTYYMRHLRPKQREDRRQSPATFLLTAAAVGILAKERACISGAAGGCQAEVGTATAMAAAGLCAVLGGTPEQVEESAEIAMEHSLGMTCDPVLGLVQVPCIERNAMGASKALNAVALVMKAPKTQRRSMLGYDDVLRVMKATGKDMSVRYRETAQGGLAADYESLLEAEPEEWEKVQEMMGTKRVQVGPRRKAARQVTYEEVAEFRRQHSERLDRSKC